MLPLSIPRVLSSSKLPFRKRYHPRLAVMFSIRVEMCAPAPKLYPVSCHDTVGALLIWIEVPGRKLVFCSKIHQIIFSNCVNSHRTSELLSNSISGIQSCEVLKGGEKSIVTWPFFDLTCGVEIKDIQFLKHRN